MIDWVLGVVELIKIGLFLIGRLGRKIERIDTSAIPNEAIGLLALRNFDFIVKLVVRIRVL